MGVIILYLEAFELIVFLSFWGKLERVWHNRARKNFTRFALICASCVLLLAFITTPEGTLMGNWPLHAVYHLLIISIVICFGINYHRLHKRNLQERKNGAVFLICGSVIELICLTLFNSMLLWGKFFLSI